MCQKGNGQSGTSQFRKVSITEIRKSNLKRSAFDIVADKTKLPRNEMEATISTAGDPRSMADIEEVVVTSTGEKGWCFQCDLLIIEVGLIHMQKELGSVKKQRVRVNSCKRYYC